MKLKAGICAGGIAIASVLVGVYQVWPHNKNSDWQLAGSIAPENLMERLAEENINSTFEVQTDQMKVLKVSLLNQTELLYLIDSRMAGSDTSREPLCGAFGCAFFGYVPTEEGYQNVLSLYLDTNLPPEVPLIEVSEALKNGMPELTVHQLEGSQLLKMKLVLNNERYEVVEIQYLPE